MINPFFKNNGPFKISDILQLINLDDLNIDNDPVKVFRKIYDSMYESLQPETIPHAILIIADYQYKSAFVADQEINLVACLTELMSQVKFK